MIFPEEEMCFLNSHKVDVRAGGAGQGEQKYRDPAHVPL